MNNIGAPCSRTHRSAVAMCASVGLGTPYIVTVMASWVALQRNTWEPYRVGRLGSYR